MHDKNLGDTHLGTFWSLLLKGVLQILDPQKYVRSINTYTAITVKIKNSHTAEVVSIGPFFCKNW